MQEYILQFFIYIVPAIFASQGLWTYLLYKRQKKDESNDLRVQADLVILHDLIYRYCKKAIVRGYTLFDEFDNVTALFNVYSKIGGNGTAKKLYDEYCTLPKKYQLTEEKEI